MAESQQELDIDIIVDQDIVPTEPIYDDIDETKEKNEEKEFVDYRIGLSITGKELKTTKRLTKYERTRIIGVRAQQLNKQAPPLVKVNGLTDTVKIAEKELEERKIPLIIRRRLPGGDYEDVRVIQLIY